MLKLSENRSEPLTIRLASGKTATRWTRREKPEVNHWYQLRLSVDYWKIQKDFHSPEKNTTYYRIVEYVNGDLIYSGKSLAQCREIIRENTYRMVV